MLPLFREAINRSGSPARLRVVACVMSSLILCAAPAAADEGPKFTAAERDFWSFRRLAHGNIPVVPDASWVPAPIDRFLLKKLAAEGLGFSPPADRATLIR